MASKMANVSPTCQKCFESFPVVKMLITCRHVFCQRCLSIQLAKPSPDSVVILCPTCRVESPLPENGVDGLADFTRDGADEEGLELLGVRGSVHFPEISETEGPKESLARIATGAVTVHVTGPDEELRAVPNEKLRDIRQCHLIFEKTYNSDITSVANLRNNFAVVTYQAELTVYRIDILEFPGTLKHSITQDIRLLGDIASTPDGNLAVVGLPYRTKLYFGIFDSETSDRISMTCPKVYEGVYLLSFDVNACHEFVILDGNKLKVFGQGGKIVLSQEVRERSKEIACSGKFVFVVVWSRCIDAYKLIGNGLVLITSSEAFEYVWDISATPDGEVTILCKRNGFICFGRSVMKNDGFSEWSFREIEKRYPRSGNISVLGHHIVASFDDKIRVFAEG